MYKEEIFDQFKNNYYLCYPSCLVNIYSNFLLTIEYNDTFWKALVEIEKYYKISSVTTV